MKALGVLLLAAGVLIEASGGIAMMVLTSQIGSGSNVPLALVFGGIPLALGLLAIWAGWKLIRKTSPQRVSARFP